MKKIFNIYSFSLAIAVLSFAGCTKQLDIDPKNSVDNEFALNTSNDVQAALVGAYTVLAKDGTSNESLYGGRLMVSTELLANTGNLSWQGTFQQYRQFNNKNIVATNAFGAAIWTTSYEAINVCNNVLNKLSIGDAANKDRVEGEAKFLRGLLYFDLVRTYAKAWNDGNPQNNPGVPIVLTPTTPQNIGDANKVTRNPVSEVYAQVIKDLTEAKSKLPEENESFATTYAASAVLARVYLTQENFASAETEATRVIDGGFSLTRNFKDEFPDPNPAAHVNNTTEDIFAVQVSNQAGFNSFNEVYAPSNKSGRGELLITNNYLKLFEEEDERGQFYQEMPNGDLFTRKFYNTYGNIKLIRLAEIYLIRAEARIRKASPDVDGALLDINAVRTRAKLADFTDMSVDAIFAEIKRERILELSFEGQRLYDAKRYKENVGSIPYNSTKLIFPIPQREIDANNNLVQN